MKRKYGIWIFLILVLILGIIVYKSRMLEKIPAFQTFFTKTILVTVSSEDSFTKEFINLTKQYDEENSDEQDFENPYFSKRLIVQGTGESLDLQRYGAKIILCGPDNLYVMQFSTQESTHSAHEKLQNMQGIDYCEPDIYMKVSETVHIYDAMSWGVPEMGVDLCSQILQRFNDRSVTVAVVDSGVYEHPFLVHRIDSRGRDFVDDDFEPTDLNSHGTHVAGTIVDCSPNLNINILPVRVLAENGRGSSLAVSLGIKYAANQGADVINLSLGGGLNETVDRAVSFAESMGCIVVAAAGNDNGDTAYYTPAHLKECIVVSALDQNLQKAEFSNWGDSVDVAAPGVDIVSCVPNLNGGIPQGDDTASMSGTSMAAPHIAAIAAMIKLEDPSRTPQQVEKVIIKQCKDLGNTGWDSMYGWGIPDLNTLFDGIILLPDTSESEKESKTDDSNVYAGVLAEYKQAAEQNFDSSMLEKFRYVNLGLWNFSVQDGTVICYQIMDLADDGTPELLIAIDEEGEPKNIVDIYGIKDGSPVRISEDDTSIGYRGRYYLCIDNRIKSIASGGALNSQIDYYRLPQNSIVLEREEQYIYDGWNGDHYTYQNSNDEVSDISREQYEQARSTEEIASDSGWVTL